RNDELIANIHAQELGIYRIGQRSLPDYVIFTDKDIYLARQLELLGVRVFNRSQSIQIRDDKISTYQVLDDQQIPIRKTILESKVISQQKNHSQQYLNLHTQTLRIPLIVKEAFGTIEKQIHRIHTEKELREIVNQLHGRPYMFQLFISTSYGKDLRLHVVG